MRSLELGLGNLPLALNSLPRTGQAGRVISPGWAPPPVGTAKGSLMLEWPEARAAAGRTAGRTH